MSRRALRIPCLLVTVLSAAGLVLPRQAAADASGCTFFPSYSPGNGRDDIPACLPGSEGCYECAYAYRDKPGYDICAENINGSVTGCAPNQPVIPDWWPDPTPTDTGPPNPAGLPPDAEPPNGTGDEGAGDEGGGGDPPPDYLYVADGGPILSPIQPHGHAPYRPHAPYQPPDRRVIS